MTVRTLAEAAAEVLNKTRASAPAEHMHKGVEHYHDQPASHVIDLGGATHHHPQGTDVGSAASHEHGQAEYPGVKPDASMHEPMKHLKPQAQNTDAHPAYHSPEEENGEEHDDSEFSAHAKYAHPTIKAPGPKLDEKHHHDHEEEEEEEEEEVKHAYEAKKHMMKEKMKKMGMKEDMEALFSGEDLSEDFRTKASAIFEAAVIARAVTVVEEMEADILAAAEESIEEVKAELEEQVDAYLNYMVEEWVNENSVAIESGLRSEIVEDFMSGLKGLFAEHYINVPEEKVEMIEAMAEENAELEAKLNEALNKNIELAQAIVESRKSELVTSVCEGLTATQSEKVKALAEGVEFTTEGEYVKKLGIIRESYVKSEPTKVNSGTKQIQLAEAAEPVVAEELAPSMAAYVNAISRTKPV